MSKMRWRTLSLVSGVMLVGSTLLTACGSDDGDSGDGKAGSSGTAGSSGSSGSGGSGGGDAGSGGDAGGDGGTAECGNSIVEGTEQCDDGNTVNGDGCDSNCSFSCTAANQGRTCDDKDACNGVETCDETTHTCQAGTALGDGESCGDNGEVCKNGGCVLASCGDGMVQGGEECDDGNATPGDGCEADCHFSCLSTDTARDCSGSAAACVNAGTCDDTTHTCTPGGNVTDGTACNNGAGTCQSGSCEAITCGDGRKEGTEECDDGNLTPDDGCEPNCRFTCLATDTTRNCSSSASACVNPGTCSSTTHTCTPGGNVSNGTACDNGAGTCNNGVCAHASCGNGTLEGGEECDDGNATANDGCEPNCRFTCLATDATRNCSSSASACVNPGTCSNTTHTCTPGGNVSNGTACQNGAGACNNGVCEPNRCGDGRVTAPEECEPPNTATCDAQCKTIAAAACGNGTLDTGEQCDDGNTSRLDGCDSDCKYEPIFRLTDLDIKGGNRPAFCSSTTNRLGQAISSTALGQLNPPLQDGIADGSTNILVQALGLDDLTGTADPSLELGIMTGAPDPAKGTWPAAGNPLDWWFLVDPSTVSAQGLPLGIIPNGRLAARALTAGPGTVTLSLLLSGSPAKLAMRNTKISATINGNPAPNRPAPPPGSLAAGLVVAQTLSATAANQGLCGDVTVESLAQIPLPEALTTGTTACRATSGSRKYTYCGAGNPVGPGCNSLLDALVGGCKVTILNVVAITPQQPDVTGTDGDVDTLTLDAANKVPATQTTGNDDAYSAYLTFTGNRAHITGRRP